MSGVVLLALSGMAFGQTSDADCQNGNAPSLEHEPRCSLIENSDARDYCEDRVEAARVQHCMIVEMDTRLTALERKVEALEKNAGK